MENIWGWNFKKKEKKNDEFGVNYLFVMQMYIKKRISGIVEWNRARHI